MQLNGVYLEGISTLIKIIDVIEHTPVIEVMVTNRAKYHGMQYLGTLVESRDIEILFDIKAKNKIVRSALLDAVLGAFDKAGVLQVDHRDGKYLNVICSQAPSITSVRDYTSTFSILYTSYDPFWISLNPDTATLSYVHSPEPATIGEAVWKYLAITPSGNVEQCLLEFTITNDSTATMNDIIIATDTQTFTFAALGLAAGKSLICAYGADGFVSFTVDGVSKMNKRTGSDDLVLNQGVSNTVGVKTIKAATVLLTARGLWK